MVEDKKLGQGPAFPQTPVANPMTGLLDTDHMYDERMGASVRYYTACEITKGLVSNTFYAQESAKAGNINIPALVSRAYEITDELLKQEHNV